MKIFKIVLTGGPCSGKTKILSSLKEYFSKIQNCKLITIPETATELISNGISPFKTQNIFDFQDIIFERQLTKEKTSEKALSSSCDEDMAIIIYDRALLDNKAYLPSSDDFNKIIYKYNYSEISILDKYDLVLDLVTVAGNDFGTYDNISNPFRFEDEAGAIDIDLKTTNSWLGHRNIKMIYPTDKIENKIEIVLSYIEELISSYQIKYTESYSIDEESSDFSLYNDNNSKLIYEKKNKLLLEYKNNFNYFITKRIYNGCSSYILSLERQLDGLTEILFSEVIDENLAEQLIKQCGINSIVEMTKLFFVYNNQILSIDFYNDKTVLNVEKTFNSPETSIPPNITIIDYMDYSYKK